MDAVRELIWTGSYGRTTIDQICEKAGVRKGSFYHFFKCKSDVAAEALDADWAARKAELDAIFSPTVPPLIRLRRFCEHTAQTQAEMQRRFGRVLGCPQFCLGSEVSTQEDRLQKKVQEMLEHRRKYLASAIRDAHAAGLVNAPDADAKSRILFAYFAGLLTQARIQNDLRVLDEAPDGLLSLLGAAAPPAAVAA